MWEGGRPRLIIDFQAERAVPKQSAECKPCAKVKVTDTPATRYMAFFLLLLVLFQPLPLYPLSSLPFLLRCAVLRCAELCCAELVLCRARQCWENRRRGKAR